MHVESFLACIVGNLILSRRNGSRWQNGTRCRDVCERVFCVIPILFGWFLRVPFMRAGGAGPVAQAMAGPIFGGFLGATCLCRLEICVLVGHKLSAGDARLM